MNRSSNSVLLYVAVFIVLVVSAVVLGSIGSRAFGHMLGQTGTDADGSPRPIVPLSANTFLEAFEGAPPQPQPWHRADWDIQRHSRDNNTWLLPEAMDAQHGADCGPPPAMHPIGHVFPSGPTHSGYEGSVFLCRDHLMTALNASGYGVIYLVPPALLDWSQSEAVLSFDVSTLRMSGRDWWDLYLTPWDDNLALPLENWLPDLNGHPFNMLTFRMDNFVNGTAFRLGQLANGQSVPHDPAPWVTIDTLLKQQGRLPSAIQRETFELRLAPTGTDGTYRLKFGMPGFGYYWYDKDVQLAYTQAVVQIGHHSYNPRKDASGVPATWHWDNVLLNPASPFGIENATPAKRFFRGAETAIFDLPAPSRPGAHARWASVVFDPVQLSTDGGTTWQNVGPQWSSRTPTDPAHARSYFVANPPGTTQLRLRGANGWWGDSKLVEGLTVWTPPSQTLPPPVRTPTLPPATVTPSPLPPRPTPLPLPSPTATPATTLPPIVATLVPVLPTPTQMPTPTPEPCRLSAERTLSGGVRIEFAQLPCGS